MAILREAYEHKLKPIVLAREASLMTFGEICRAQTDGKLMARLLLTGEEIEVILPIGVARHMVQMGTTKTNNPLEYAQMVIANGGLLETRIEKDQSLPITIDDEVILVMPTVDNLTYIRGFLCGFSDGLRGNTPEYRALLVIHQALSSESFLIHEVQTQPYKNGGE